MARPGLSDADEVEGVDVPRAGGGRDLLALDLRYALLVQALERVVVFAQQLEKQQALGAVLL
jgi:hypothetical protein